MTTYTTYADGQPQGPSAGPASSIAAYSGGDYSGAPKRTVLTGVFDGSRRNMIAADVAQVLNIPAGTWVEAVVLEIVTPEATGSSTISVGDGNGASSWVSAVDDTAVAGTFYLGAGAYAIATGTSQTNGLFYAAADTLDILVPTGKVVTTLKCKIHAICTIL